MVELKLNYNPYSLKTEIWSIEAGEWGKIDERDDIVGKLQNRSLQSWFRKGENWKGLCEELMALNEDIKIAFEGRECDFADFRALCGSHTGQFSITVTAPASFSYSDEDAKNKLAAVRDEIASSELRESEEMRPAIDEALENYKNMMGGWFDVAVIATMSSGKSTLINALLRDRLQPTGNMATTAKIVRIFNDDEAQGFTYECFSKSGDDLGLRGEVTAANLVELNNVPDVFRIDMKGNIPGISSGGLLNLRLIDTPGPNNSATEEHREVTYSVINDKKRQPLILFIQDATKLEDKSEYTLLRDIARAMKDGDTDSLQAQERFLFVINRADTLDAKTGENIAEFVEKEKDYLRRQFGISSAQMIPICARAALLQGVTGAGKIVIDEDEEEENEDEDLRDLRNLRKKLRNKSRDLVSAADLSPTCRDRVARERARAEAEGDDSMLTMINSGIYGLEQTIDEYLRKYAMPYKVYQCKNAMARKLANIRNNLKFEDSIASDTARLEEAEAQQAELEGKIESLRERNAQLSRKTSSIKDDGYIKIIRKAVEAISDVRNNLGGDYDARDINGKEYMHKDDAKRLTRKADRLIRDAIDEMREELLQALGECVRSEFSEAYREFSCIVDEFRKEFSKFAGIDGGDMSSLSDLMDGIEDESSYSIASYLNENPIKAETVKYTVTKTREVDNPKRKGFFGFFKVWQPRTITESYREERSVEDMVIIRDVKMAIGEHSDRVREECEKAITDGMEDIYAEKKDALIALGEEIERVIKDESGKIKGIIDSAKALREDIAKQQARKDEIQKNLAVVQRWIDELETLGG